jgi:predicted N-acyltransferase
MKTDSRVITDFASIDPAEWARLDTRDNPFLSWNFLHALDVSGSVSEENGWQSYHLCIYERDRLVACAPTYLKSNSRGEFVFDWAWADAYHRHGLNYYPKLLTAVPFSPITGPRLLVHSEARDPQDLRRSLVELAASVCEDNEFSSWHCNFLHSSDAPALDSDTLLQRSDWQFHWINQGYDSFDDFLTSLRAKKRKNIRHERRDVTKTGIGFVRLHGGELNPSDLDFVFRCYQQTFYEHGNYAALNREFFEQLVESMGEQLLIILARLDQDPEKPVAMGFFIQGGNRLYGRYWGAVGRVPGLHFETAYYQGIEYCIDNGIEVFESGAQGEHKISRGFTPVKTHSRHLIRHPGFRTAISDFLEREAGWQAAYGLELAARSPYCQPDGRDD